MSSAVDKFAKYEEQLNSEAESDEKLSGKKRAHSEIMSAPGLEEFMDNIKSLTEKLLVNQLKSTNARLATQAAEIRTFHSRTANYESQMKALKERNAQLESQLAAIRSALQTK